tara:strand:- start:600 stop:1133 length:534 start_codon:yes stop_codon:yes gene_type:complete
MAKKFSIHEWQAKQRKKLFEVEGMESSGDEKLKRAIEPLADMYSYGEILDALESFYTKNDEQVYAKMARKHAKEFRDFLDNEDEGLDEHHAGDYKPGFLKQSVSTFLDKLKKKNETDYNKVEKIMEKYFSAKKTDEISMTGTGASFQAGSGEAYATPKAFGDKKRRKQKGYMGYKEV